MAVQCAAIGRRFSLEIADDHVYCQTGRLRSRIIQHRHVRRRLLRHHLAWTNGSADEYEWECGAGAVVPWAGKLWFLTYPAHKPFGSRDKLVALHPDLTVEVCPESVGGTHACRMIHRESEQLIIGPYFIDRDGNVRAVPPAKMEGRLTGVARHLTDPANKVIFYTMESGLYEVDVHTLEVTTLYRDPNHTQPFAYLLPGVHGKGAYSGQGVLVVSNNGLGGVLAALFSAENVGGNSNNMPNISISHWSRPISRMRGLA